MGHANHIVSGRYCVKADDSMSSAVGLMSDDTSGKVEDIHGISFEVNINI